MHQGGCGPQTPCSLANQTQMKCASAQTRPSSTDRIGLRGPRTASSGQVQWRRGLSTSCRLVRGAAGRFETRCVHTGCSRASTLSSKRTPGSVRGHHGGVQKRMAGGPCLVQCSLEACWARCLVGLSGPGQPGLPPSSPRTGRLLWAIVSSSV